MVVFMGSSGLCVVTVLGERGVDVGQGQIDGNLMYLTVDKLALEDMYLFLYVPIIKRGDLHGNDQLHKGPCSSVRNYGSG
jgi:hypothetical protein